MWNDMFVIALPVLEKILRPVLVYLALVVLLRIFGKRELAQLNPFDLVVLLSLSNTVQNAIIGNDNSVTGGLIGALTLLATNYLVVRFLFRHRRLDPCPIRRSIRPAVRPARPVGLYVATTASHAKTASHRGTSS